MNCNLFRNLLCTDPPFSCKGGNILVLPIEGSHWINMEFLIKSLHSRGHNLTVMRPSNSWYIREKSSYYSTFTVPVKRSFYQEFITKIIFDIIQFERGALPLTSFFGASFGMFSTALEIHRAVSEFVSAMLDDAELIKTLNNTKFDVVLTDPCWGSGAILAKYLNLPLVFNVRWIISEEGHFGIAPSPLSYVPITGSGNTDKMTFFQRVKNNLLYSIVRMNDLSITKRVYQPLCEKYLGPDCDFDILKINADIWLMRTDFVFDYPRPTMPNVVYIGGFQCKPAESLPVSMEEFVQSSGDHGVIIMSLGTFVPELPEDLVNEIAAAFSKLPQKVIWSYKGNKPSTLGNNTLVVDWMPQKDLLGHPKVKLFVAHGGTNGLIEAIYHGVPVVGLPLFFDQYDNLLRLEVKGAAKILTLSTVDKDDNFLKAIQEVLNEPSYRLNMQRLSRLHRDPPMKPIETAIFWMEFVMRHKGAAHLKAQSYRMPWYIYHSVDVVLFLSAAVLLMLTATVMFIRCLWKAVCRRKVKAD
uniref:UDP-glucuronosyltransferase n=1 Tax=Cyprinodon variegatus TaxID=28743 RepID=A0A3Q2G263_CYPVA